MDELTKMILSEMTDIKKQMSHIREDITKVRVDIATLKAKSIFLGGLVGTVMSGIVVTFFSYIKK